MQKRKENNLCLKCGKSLDRDGVYCVDCKDKINAETKETRKWYQDNGICPRCRKNKIYATEKNCPECIAKSYALIMPKRETKREEYNKSHAQWSKKTHKKMIENGICTRCRKRKADSGFKTCGICREKTRNYKRMKYGKEPRKDREEKGLCYFCDNPIKNGYKVCKKHYQMNVEKSRSDKAVLSRKKLIKQAILY